METVTRITNAEGKKSSNSLYIVGIGASAGGLEALEEFFDSMPADSGLAFVVIQHLSPDYRSLMDELLSRHTQLAIHRVENEMLVEKNSIYLIPPKKEMIISGQRLLLKDRDPEKGLSLPIDTFFRSLAHEVGQCSVGIILSGTGSDGSRGVQAINEAGGLVLVQDLDSAKFDGMPRTAIQKGTARHIVNPGKMPELILKHVRREAGEETGGCLTPEDAMQEIFNLLRLDCGIDFSHYKSTTVARRIDRRLKIIGINRLEEYVDLLRSDNEELNLLYKDLLIGVTEFFRDQEAFRILKEEVIPEILERVPEEEEIRFWVAGCATGEEAYSLAILLHEELAELKRAINAKIFATDVHRGSIEIASAGIYDQASVANVEPKRLERYFIPKNDKFQVCPDLRKMVVFAPHDVIRDAPFTKMELITCRNLLIYLEAQVQRKVTSLFHFSLRAGGFLFLGPSETPGDIADEFNTVDRHWKIYKKRRDIRLQPIRLSPPTKRPTNDMPRLHQTRPNGPHDLQLMDAYDALLDRYIPPSFLVNERGELLHTFHGAGEYLKIRDGRSTQNVLDMVSNELRLFLTGALQRAEKEKKTVIYNGVPENGDKEQIRLTVQPIVCRDYTYFLIALEKGGHQSSASIREDATINFGEATRERIGTLEQELRHTKENLQATIEELETSNEELQATNEELLASNEELQSTNEELQSVNEELHTVNAEHQRKISELTQLTDDMNNLLRGTEMGTIFLDRNLCIRKFTPQITEVFQILPQDVGRPIHNFARTIDYPTLLDDVASALEDGERIEKQVRDRNGNWCLVRILPYRTDKYIEGVVLTVVDISNLKRMEHDLERMSKVFSEGADPVIFEDLEYRILDVNKEAERRYGRTRQDLAGKQIFELIPPNRHEEMRRLRKECLIEKHVRDVEGVRLTKSGREIPILLTLFVLSDDQGNPSAIVSIAKDIARQKQAEQEAILAASRRDQFLTMLSHELRNPLGAVLNASYVLDDKKAEPPVIQSACQIIQRQTKQMSRLLDDLLDISRITQGKIEIRKQVLVINELVEEAVDTIRPLLNAKGHELKLNIPEEPIFVCGDRARLLQIQENLLTNAIKYTPPGGMIQISLKGEKDELELEIKDNGVGINPKMLDQIFELFVQTQEGLDRSEGGMGVGLTLVRDLVRLHGGLVSAHSEGEGKGCSIKIRLPLSEEGSEFKPKEGPAIPAGKPPRILIVEDNADSREMLAAILRLEGIEVLEAADGKDGLDIITEQNPDLAFVDVGLPILDGYGVARKARESNSSTYLVALTGFGKNEDRQAVRSAGFHEHLVKPLTRETLEGILRRIGSLGRK